MRFGLAGYNASTVRVGGIGATRTTRADSDSTRYASSADPEVVEGVMGLYDGDGSSTAMVAESLDC